MPGVKCRSIMKLSYLLDEIKLQIDKIGNCGAYLIRENPEKKDDFLELPIKEVGLDSNDNEINIYAEESQTKTENPDNLLNVNQLYNILLGFMPDASDFSLFASHPIIDPESEYTFRLDVPIVAHALNESENRFGLLEESSDST